LLIETGLSDGINIEMKSGLDTISKVRAEVLEEKKDEEKED
jgi:hypothetical protein